METLTLSTVNIVLMRMMNEALFADAVFEDPDLALSEYNLVADIAARFKLISRAAFMSMTLDERNAFASWVVCPKGTKNPLEESATWLNKINVLPIQRIEDHDEAKRI